MAQPPLPPRSGVAVAFAAAPVVTAAFLMAAVGLLYVLGQAGGRAAGERSTITFSGPCLAEARDLIEARVEEIGLGDPVFAWETGSMEATMPGLDDDATHIPRLLARRGRLEVRAEGVVADNAALISAILTLDENGQPYTELLFGEEAIGRLTEAGALTVEVDGAEVPSWYDTKTLENGKIRLLPGEGDTRTRMRVATDHTIVLHHGPLPCELGVGRS